jgi:broad specificity phosphatase PhoE
MDIFLVRHGEAAASWGESPDPGLSQLGQQQAEAAARQISACLVQDTLLLSSPLQRAIETAVPLARLLQQSVQEDAAFSEIPAPVPLAQRQTWLRQFMQQDWAGQSEDLKKWRETAIQQLLTIKQSVVVFTHFLLINAVVGKLLNRPQTLCFWPANGSVTRLHHNGSSLELIALGQEMESFVN